MSRFKLKASILLHKKSKGVVVGLDPESGALFELSAGEGKVIKIIQDAERRGGITAKDIHAELNNGSRKKEPLKTIPLLQNLIRMGVIEEIHTKKKTEIRKKMGIKALSSRSSLALGGLLFGAGAVFFPNSAKAIDCSTCSTVTPGPTNSCNSMYGTSCIVCWPAWSEDCCSAGNSLPSYCS